MISSVPFRRRKENSSSRPFRLLAPIVATKDGTLAGAGPAGDDGQIVPEYHLYTLSLPLEQRDAKLSLHPLHNRR